ncbi:hypothetical protein RB594_001446 [Gaeumannomyces avenae]
MAADQPRVLLQSAQMSNFSFAPQQTYRQPRETQKNYVFVDEHNRHKRLKVMRACEGCRRRKIKCDAATTNTWPCSACIRLKLHCVRPNGLDGTSADGQAYELLDSDYDNASAQSGATLTHVPADSQPQQQLFTSVAPATSASEAYTTQSPYGDSSGTVYNPSRYTDTRSTHGAALQYTSNTPSVGLGDPSFGSPDVFPTPPMQRVTRSNSPPESYTTETHGQDLADLLGPLRLNEAGTAPYLNNKMRAKELEEEPVLNDDDEFKSSLPPLPSGPGLKIRIPPELMPDEETALHYFDLYFSHVHPYVPVLDKIAFYDQWHNNRESMSPLVLEAVFAIAGRLADDPGDGQQWLALATRHLDSFMDVPRISTLQALLIVLKAREAAPKRGYYYRSWMAIVHCVQMGKDLGLDEHYLDHQDGHPCNSSPSECLMKTRLWQTIFVCEVMIGSPQGRTDLSVKENTVDLSVPRLVAGIDESEYHVSRNLAYLTRVVANVARMNRTYARVRRKNPREWGLDTEFVRLTPLLHAWLNELPSDLAVNFPPDGSSPWLASPFIGNLHSYHYLSVIMLHRPQLQCLDPTTGDGQWKHHMLVCHNSAKFLCRLEEAVLRSFGLGGLQCMQRGINFTIYAILTCIVLHLVAVTSPDLDLNSDAREYFTRHMRLLEKCMAAWPMPDMQRQVDAVREAFSADTRKPFVLKPSFPYGSPHSTSATPPRSVGSRTAGGRQPMIDTRALGQLTQQLTPPRQQSQHQTHQHPPHVSYISHPISPPISAGPSDGTGDSSPAAQAAALMSGVPGSQAPRMPPQQSLPLADAATAWNPSRLFDQWNTTFGTPQPPPQPQPQHVSSVGRNTSLSGLPGAPEVPTLQDIQAVQGTMPNSIHQTSAQTYPTHAPVQTFVTPAMWQESVASVYEGGLKRAWDYDASGLSMAKHR